YLLKHLLMAATLEKNADAIEAGLAVVRVNFKRLGNLFFYLLCLGGDKGFKDLLPHIPDPNWVDKEGDTLLSLAFLSKDKEMISLLLGDKRIALKENWNAALVILPKHFDYDEPRPLERINSFLIFSQFFFSRCSPEMKREMFHYFRTSIDPFLRGKPI